jgi:hypothetical protein
MAGLKGTSSQRGRFPGVRREIDKLPILPLSEDDSRAIIEIHLGRAAGAAPVEEIQRLADRITPTSQQNQQSAKMRFLFFRQAIKIGLLKGPCSSPGAGTEEGTRPLRQVARMDCLSA